MARINIKNDNVEHPDEVQAGEEFTISFTLNNRETLAPDESSDLYCQLQNGDAGHLADVTVIGLGPGIESFEENIDDVCAPVEGNFNDPEISVDVTVGEDGVGDWSISVIVDPHGDDPKDQVDTQLTVTEPDISLDDIDLDLGEVNGTESDVEFNYTIQNNITVTDVIVTVEEELRLDSFGNVLQSQERTVFITAGDSLDVRGFIDHSLPDMNMFVCTNAISVEKF